MDSFMMRILVAKIQLASEMGIAIPVWPQKCWAVKSGGSMALLVTFAKEPTFVVWQIECSLSRVLVFRSHGQLLKPTEEPDNQFARPMFGDGKQLRWRGLLRPVSDILCTQNITIVNGRFAPEVPGVASVFCAAIIFPLGKGLGVPSHWYRTILMLYPPLISILCQATCLSLFYWPMGGASSKLPKVTQH